MNKSYLCFLMVLVLFFTACIPRKDLIYLQRKDGKKEAVVKPLNPSPYKIQSDDNLSISIVASDPKLVSMFNVTGGSAAKVEQSAYFDGYRVDDHGNIKVPFLGEVNVLGLTTDEIRVKIENLLLANYFNKEADVFVNVKLLGIRFTFLGEISGTKVIYRDKVSVLEAIANSGGISEKGDRKNVLIMRQQIDGLEMHTIDLTDINVMYSPCYFIQPNDIIYIKPARLTAWQGFTAVMQSIGTVVTSITFLLSTYLIFKSF